jgi:hypothetical protein
MFDLAGSPYAITTPTTTMVLQANRQGEATFSVTNQTAAPLRSRAVITPLGTTPAAWLSVKGKAERDLPANGTEQFVVVADPPLGVAAGSYGFRLDIVGIERPDEIFSQGPDCAFEVPASQAVVHVAKGYVAAMLGAVIGGALGELVIVIAYVRSDHSQAACPQNDIACGLGQGIGEVIAFVFAVLFGLFLLWIGATIGTYVGLRVHRYLGSKRTALFVFVLYVPWTILMLSLLNVINLSLPVALSVAPILLLIVPALLARGALLLIKTHHI